MRPYRNWYAIYTRPRWEKKVASLLERKGIECYCPLNKVQKQWADRKKVIYEPLFTSYVFVCISNEEMLRVKQTDGVLNFVYWLGKPAVIRPEEIDAIREFLHEYETVSIERVDRINPNDKIQIVHGPLMLREGTVVEVGQKKVKVLIPSIGFNLVAEVEITNIAKMKSIA